VSTLAERVEEYLALRRSLGFKLGRAGQLLTQFAAHCQAAGCDRVTTELALAWARQPAAAHPLWWSYRLSAVRSFARYLHAVDTRHEVPPADLLPRGPRLAQPFIYSTTDIANLLTVAAKLSHPLMSATYRTYISLLAVTGMRAGEAIRLDRDDVNWAESLLPLRFHHKRQVGG